MKKALDFSTYKKFQKLSFNDTNRLFYANAYDDCKKEIMEECVASLTEDRLLEILLSVKGIGKTRAQLVVQKIIEEGISYGIET